MRSTELHWLPLGRSLRVSQRLADGRLCFESKKQCMFKMTKTFKHEDVYNILKCSLPKYELVFSSIDSRVARAVFLLDSDANAGVVRINGLTHANSTDTVDPLVPVCDIERTSLLNPRPSIGKRKGKAIEFSRQQEKKRQESVATKTPIAIPLTNQQLMVEAAKNGRNMALNRLAAAAERKNNMAYEQNMSQYYTNHPNSAEAVTFFAAMGQRYKDQQQEQVLLAKSVQNLSNRAAVSPQVLNVEEVADEESIEPDEDDNEEQDEMPGTLPSTQVMIARMRVMAKNKPSTACSRINDSQETTWEDSMKPNAVLRYGLLDYAPLSTRTRPLIDLSLLKGSNVDDDDK